MKPVIHLLSGLFLALLLFFISPLVGILEAVVIFFSSFLIDLDYLLYNFYKNKKISLIGTYNYAKSNGLKYRKLSNENREKYFGAIRVFHGVESLIVLGFFGYFIHELFYFAGVGIFIHLLMDYYHEAKYKLRHDKFSIILSYFRFKKLKQIS